MEGTTPAYRWGFIAGAIVGLLLVALLMRVLLGRKRGSKREYDERQQLAIGKGYQCGYYTLLIYIAVYALTDLMLDLHWCNVYTGLFIGVLLSVGVFGCVCIKMDAYLPLRESPRRYIAMFMILGGMNVVIGVVHYIEEGTFLENGMLSNAVVNPLVGVLLMTLAAALAIKTLREKREQEADWQR